MQGALWAICGTAFVGLLTLAVEWLKTGQAQTTGAQLQAGATAAATARTEAAVAQAVVDAPQGQLAVIDRLKSGTF